jgi:lipopolysaccharide transport system permease protein
MVALACLWFACASPPGEQFAVTWAIALLPAVLLLIAIQALGFGLWMAAITAKYRDLQHVSTVLIQLWMYGSAVVVPLSRVPEKYRAIAAINPVTFSIESFRCCLLGRGTVSWEAGACSVAISLLVLVSGVYLFNRTAKTFVDIA